MKSCPGLFGGGVAEVSGSGWFVLFILLGLVGVLVVVTMRHRSEHAGLDCNTIMEIIPMDRTACLMCILSVPGALLEVVVFIKDKITGWRGGGGPKYGALPDSAVDDELDLGEDELMDDEAEELHDDDARLNTLPPSQPPPRPGADVGSLIGDDFTSPHAGSKKGA